MPDTTPGAGSSDPRVDEGFTRVDAQPDATFLVRTMDATAQWPAVRRLRAWEAAHLAPRPGEAILDVGCGLGEVARALAPAVQPGGRVLGVDASEAFLAVARQRADDEGVRVEFRIDDATSLSLGDATFDVCRSERMLQWLPDVEQGVAEIVRVLRPGGRLCLIDTDWETLAIDLPTQALAEAMTDAVVAYRGASSLAGRRLLNVARRLGLVDVDCRADTHVWSEWDVENEDGRAGFFPLASTVGQLAEQGYIDPATAQALVDEAYEAARAGRFYMSLSMTAVFGRRSS